MRFFIVFVVGGLLGLFTSFPQSTLHAAEKKPEGRIMEAQIQEVARANHIKWTYIAAVANYEEHKTSKSKGIEWPGYLWAGPWNPNPDERAPQSLRLFGGVGLDGNKDGLADPTVSEDSLASLGYWLSRHGHNEDAFRAALEEKYDRENICNRIMGFAKVYSTFNQYGLTEHAFPIPKRYDYSYRDTWGDKRGWGGRRIHEGTDIFAGYGTPVLASTYGYIEEKGWNKYGGWRLGLRGMDNVYYYYAHLSSFAKGMSVGTVVKPGQLLGYVGSSGYGKPGTSGKFPPHLHYGMYRGGGPKEWAFDPYPYLRQWERQKKIT